MTSAICDRMEYHLDRITIRDLNVGTDGHDVTLVASGTRPASPSPPSPPPRRPSAGCSDTRRRTCVSCSGRRRSDSRDRRARGSHRRHGCRPADDRSHRTPGYDARCNTIREVTAGTGAHEAVTDVTAVRQQTTGLVVHLVTTHAATQSEK